MININQILKSSPRRSAYGAPLGDRSFYECPPGVPLAVQQVQLVDGGYGRDGTYWGHSDERLYCAFNVGGPDGSSYVEGVTDPFVPGFGVRIYIRAKTRKEAIRRLVDEWLPRVGEITIIRRKTYK